MTRVKALKQVIDYCEMKSRQVGECAAGVPGLQRPRDLEKWIDGYQVGLRELAAYIQGMIGD